MTAILKDLRTLDERLKRGELSPAQYHKAKDRLLQSVEVAQTDFDPAPAPRRHTPPATAPSAPPRQTSSTAIGFGLVVCLGVMGASIALILVFLPDINLALTLGVTILAALTVGLLRDLDR